MNASTDFELIEQFKNGNEEAFRVLVDRYKKDALRLAWRYANDLDRAEDIVQDAFIQVFRSLPQFRGEAMFSTWFYKIVVNMSLNAIKKEKKFKHQPLMEVIDVSGSSSEYENESNSFKQEVIRAMEKLSEKQRMIFNLRHLEQMSTRQVSHLMKISEGSVKQHLHRAAQHLKKSLAGFNPEKQWSQS